MMKYCEEVELLGVILDDNEIGNGSVPPTFEIDNVDCGWRQDIDEKWGGCVVRRRVALEEFIVVANCSNLSIVTHHFFREDFRPI